MNRTRIGILFGGPSAEHRVSAASALGVARGLPAADFAPVVIGIDKDRRFQLIPESIVSDALARNADGPAIEDGFELGGREVELRGVPGTSRVALVAGEQVMDTVDVMFPVLHGPFGEDGVLQGLLEWLGVPYVGCGIGASAVGMDKVAMKRAFIAEGVPVTPHVWVDQSRWDAVTDPMSVVRSLEFPLFVKPANMGSSIGISRVAYARDLPKAMARAFAHDRAVTVEQGITGRELECGVLGGTAPTASAVGEVTVTGGWFDYDQKYFGSADPMIVPAQLPASVVRRIQELSIRAFRAVGGWGLSRVDFLFDEAADRVYVNEINTMPGFTAHSMYPKVWAESGVSFATLITTLIGLAVQRHNLRRHP